MPNPIQQRISELAYAIDAERAQALERELGTRRERALCVLLGTAFPAWAPIAAFQVDAVDALSREGLGPQRRQRELLRAAAAESSAADQPAEFEQALRRFVWKEKARIALRELLPLELGGAPLATTARELSLLAAVALESSLREAAKHVAARFGAPLRSDGEGSMLCAFGLGKLGGHELNAGSDIDLLFAYDTDDGGSRELSLNEHWSRVVRRAVAILDTPSAQGRAWRVDLRLRPEGASGAIVNSMAALERYYETWGRLWERAALLRALPVAGDVVFGEFVAREVFAPFVYRHAVDTSIASGLCELVERSRRELSKDPSRDLKLGRGGIREAEFFVQTLQLIWGGREPSLRVQNTLSAVERLESRGQLSDREARALTEGYTFLRKLEHRIQWFTGQQTHSLPENSEDLARIGRTLGYPDERRLLTEVSRVRSAIAALFDSISPESWRRTRVSRFDELLVTTEDGVVPSQRLEQVFGSADVTEHILALARRPDGPLGSVTRDRYPELPGQLLQALWESPDPEQAARYLRSFFGRFFAPEAYVIALAEDPRTLTRLLSVFGSSRFVGDQIVTRPDLADTILYGGGMVSDPRAAIAIELHAQRVDTNAGATHNEAEQDFLTALNVAKRRVQVEVAIADLAGTISTRSVTRLLSQLADEVLDRATTFACEGDPRGLSLIALGKLGGHDIGYGSDLDVLFIYDPAHAPPGVDAQSFFTRRAQQIIRLLTVATVAGPGYALDVRLRPSGSQGMLVSSIEAFARYHAVPLEHTPLTGEERATVGSAAPWERQVLLRARANAGDRELGARVEAIARHAAYRMGPPPLGELRRLRGRLELELGRERPGRYDLKCGRGGLLDIEFCAQWLQMLHGQDAAVHTTDTGEALEALALAGYLDRRHNQLLQDGYRFLRRLEQRIHILTGIGSSLIDAQADGLPALARRLGMEDEPGNDAGKKLIDRYEVVTSGVRTAFQEVLDQHETTPDRVEA